jgi:hypothetical protein
MSLTAALATKDLAVEPGGEASCEVRVKNRGRIVDEFTFEVVGDTAPWATVEPPTVSLMPGTEGTAQLLFRPPRVPTVQPGATPFGVKVSSKEDPDSSQVQEGVVVVGAFADTAMELIPRAARGRWSAKYELALDNRGNGGVNAAITPVDPDDQLRFDLKPPTLVADPGTATFGTVVVRPRKRFFLGPPQTRTFRVVADAKAAAPLTADGTLLQESLVPRWAPRAFAAALAALLALLALWYAGIKPAVKDEAEKTAAEQIQAAAVTPGGGAGGGAGGGGGGETTPVAAGEAVVNRLAQGGSFEVPGDQTLRVTDVVLENGSGAAGTLEIRRNDDLLFSFEAANFRDLDYHFVTPVIFKSGEKLRISGSCGPCAVVYSGFLAK